MRSGRGKDGGGGSGADRAVVANLANASAPEGSEPGHALTLPAPIEVQYTYSGARERTRYGARYGITGTSEMTE